jgi:hypothetical protein
MGLFCFRTFVEITIMGLGLNEISAERPLPVAANDSSIASDGVLLQVDDLAQTFAYNVDGTLNYIQVTQSGSNYRQTYGYTDGRITSISNWVKQ